MVNCPQVRVVVFKDQDQWVAQCLEHDICVQAPHIDQIPPRMKSALWLEIDARGLEKLPRAPDQFFKMWEQRSELFKYSGSDCEMALCA